VIGAKLNHLHNYNEIKSLLVYVYFYRLTNILFVFRNSVEICISVQYVFSIYSEYSRSLSCRLMANKH